MKSVAAQAGLPKRAGQGHDVGDVRVAAVERRVEAGHVKRGRIAGAGGAEDAEAPGLVKRVQGDERETGARGIGRYASRRMTSLFRSAT